MIRAEGARPSDNGIGMVENGLLAPPRHFIAITVDGILAIEAEKIGIAAQKTDHIGIGGKFVVTAVFKRFEKVRLMHRYSAM